MTTTATRTALQAKKGSLISIVVDPANAEPGDLTDLTLNEVELVTAEQRAIVDMHKLAGYRWTAAYCDNDGEWRLGFHKPTGRMHRYGGAEFEYRSVTA